jgi:heat shock protein HtpX
MSAPAVESFYDQISANRRRSIFLVFVITALLAVFGFVVGFALTGYWQGGVFAIGVAVLVAGLLSAVSYYAGDSIVLTTSGAQEVNEQTAPQLMNIV